MIISLFGPDGVGKSSIATDFQGNGFMVFSGTGVATWPDQTWASDLVARGLDESRIDEQSHFMEKIRRCHEMARELEAKSDVVIDSDPFHKTAIHDLMKLDVDQSEYFKGRFQELLHMAKLKRDSIHLHMQVADNMSHEDQAKILYDRIRSRGALAPFDPETIEESMKMIHACQSIANELRKMGYKVVAVKTLERLDFESIKFKR